jgi:uncharacterized protein YndB with AHSA1/START domain
MTDRSVEHATFTIERTYPASPARVFAAWAEPEAKARWFPGAGENWELDFRVGGRETSRGEIPDGPTFELDALYQEIVEDERIVYTYSMDIDGQRTSVSIATVELKPEGDGTLLTFTEQGAFFDGLDSGAERQSGTGTLLDALGKELDAEAAASA